MREDLASTIQQLIVLGKGDVGRLEYILDLLRKGKVLPISDQKYLENTLSLYSDSINLGNSQYEHMISELHKEIESLNEKISSLEKTRFKKLGKKAIFFFVTVFVGWNVLQSYIVSILNLDMSNGLTQYLFPLNVFVSFFDANYVITFIFITMILAWPFIGAAILMKNASTGRTSTIRSQLAFDREFQ